MEFKQKVEIKVPAHEKCSFVLDSDCPLGQLFDYICVVRSFVIQKMKESEQETKKHDIQPEE